MIYKLLRTRKQPYRYYTFIDMKLHYLSLRKKFLFSKLAVCFIAVSHNFMENVRFL